MQRAKIMTGLKDRELKKKIAEIARLIRQANKIAVREEVFSDRKLPSVG